MHPPSLPLDVVNYILELAGYHKWRHGKYMRQLHKSSLLCVPMLQKRHYFDDTEYTAHYAAIHNNRVYNFFITTEIFMNRVHWYLDVFDAETYKVVKKKCLHYEYNDRSRKHRPKKSKKRL
jgi:hypothetical protein